ncbi:hypothetical protein SETIT_2G032000v2 [Setaria italica]|uniref:Uncharacterized protein n=1 Tax=Setaria italica TaxID=4555 RepID=K3ZYD5_SETIT|nr:hypothetical protein SETIT_2G032000v2 [Setaria italica]
MALRSLIGKLRGAPAAEAASRAFSQKCEHCGKTSSRIAVPLGQKDGAIKNDSIVFSFETPMWKHYVIRVTSVVASCTLSWLIVKTTAARIEDDLSILKK